MKEKKRDGNRSPLFNEAIFRKNPVPFGDVRKYYYAGMIETVVLLAVCFYISFSAVVLRTDSCVQIPNGIIAVLLLCALLSIVGHYSRTLAGYGLSAVMGLIIVLVLQLCNGGIMLKSNLSDYGEVVREGIKGTDFWILLAKVLAVVHMLLSVVFINSTLKVKEEPPVKGMNIKIQKFREWFAKKDAVTSLGWRPSEFWMACVCLALWMLVAQANPFETGRYDYIAMILVILGVALVFVGKAYVGALCLIEGLLTCCSMYQLRFGWSLPTVGAYVGVWMALTLLFMEAYRRRSLKGEREWNARLGSRIMIRIPVNEDTEEVDRGLMAWKTICVSGAVIIVLLMLPIHEFLSGFAGSYMNQPKDNLPLYFFLPLAMLVCAWGGTALGYLCSAIVSLGLFDAIYDVSVKFSKLFLFNSNEQHGVIGELLTDRMNGYVFCVECLVLVYFIVSMITTVMVARRKYGKPKETLDN